MANLAYEMPQDLPKDFTLGILGNQEILEECQIWEDAYFSAQSPFKKLDFSNSS